MRINIKIKGKKIKDRDIKALYIIRYALESIEPRMIKPTLDFFNNRHGNK